MTIDNIKNNIDKYTLDDIAHFWKVAKIHMEKTKKDPNNFEQLQKFQNFLEKKMKEIKRSKKTQLLKHCS